MIEIWAQDSNVKGLRMVKFRQVEGRPSLLEWLGEIDEPEKPGLVYGRQELIDHKWERMS